ncbi:hypothetical protein AX16_002316 [Volvariella volvacea WC 439]|nr:hypothetical protein AX16_002316 [Volvariella volvacea WC 439]
MHELLPVAAILCFLYLLRRKQHKFSLPPGPPGRFLIGNALNIPKRDEWKVYAEWGKIYDPDVIHLNLAGRSMIIINSIDAAKELLERRSASYSSKPTFPMICEVMGWDFAFAFMKYGPSWRDHRKIVTQSFRPSVVTRFAPHVLKSTHTFLRSILAEPDDYRYHVRHMSSELIILITYGIQVRAHNDPYIELSQKALASLTENGVPGRWLVDALPWLKYIPDWMPFAEFKHKAKEWRKLAKDMVEVPYQAVKKDVLSGNCIESVVADGLREITGKEDFEELERVVKNSAGMMYTAGSDTTITTILNAILALMCHPKVLKKAQAEIDGVVQPGHLPEFKDRDSLPYLSAVIKEAWRWAVPSPLAVHSSETEDTYKGYRIPGNSTIMVNLWGMAHNEDTYPEPHVFNPERFLKDGKPNSEVLNPEDIVFGFGRRICPGRYFASMTVWMTIACLVALFDISKPVDENGNTIEPPMEWESTMVAPPLPFKCKFVPRSQEATVAIQRTENYEYFQE